VLNDDEKTLGSGLPATSVAPVLTETIYVAPSARLADGVKVADVEAAV
jgi:hypothetical protein